MSERKIGECRCRGKTENCLYCRGTGIIEDKDAAEQIGQKLSKTRVAQCYSCGRQNRIMDDILKQGVEPLCYACGGPIFRNCRNIVDLFRFNRKKE